MSHSSFQSIMIVGRRINSARQLTRSLSQSAAKLGPHSNDKVPQQALNHADLKSSTIQNDQESNDSDPSDQFSSALADRFQLILDQKLSTGIGSSSIVNLDPKLKSIYDKYSSNPSEEQVRASVYINSEPLLVHNKHAKDIYNASAWKGTENIHDSNLRMILDSKPPPMPIKRSHDRIFSPPVSFKDRVTNAKEGSLDYKLGKGDKSESEKFREMFKEKLLGPAMFFGNSPSNTIDLVGSVASNKINASLDLSTGKFDEPNMLHVRGKPLDRKHLKNSRDSSYFMNQILNRQQVLPPWIESQQNIDTSTSNYHRDLDNLWNNWIINRSNFQDRIHNSNTLASLNSLYETSIKHLVYNPSYLTPSEQEYVHHKTKLLNDIIRSYNLQSPSTNLHKHKLLSDTELSNSFTRTIEQFPVYIERWFKRNNRDVKPQNTAQGGGGGLLSLWSQDSSGGSSNLNIKTDHYQRPDNLLGLWKAVKDVLKISR